jgi:hypothetical protein
MASSKDECGKQETAEANMDLRIRFTKLFATNPKVVVGFGNASSFPEECKMLLDRDELLRYVEHAPSFYHRLPRRDLLADDDLIELILKTHGETMFAQVAPYISSYDATRDCAISRLLIPIVAAKPACIKGTRLANDPDFLRRVVALNKDVLEFAPSSLTRNFRFILTCMLVNMEVQKLDFFSCLSKLTHKSQVQTLLEAFDYDPLPDQASPSDQDQVQASPSEQDQVQASPSEQSHQDKASPSEQDQVQASPSEQSHQVQASPSE